MAENTTVNAPARSGRLFLREKDFVEVVDAEGNELPSVPKHWGEDQLAPGAKFKKKASGRNSSSSGKDGGKDGGGSDPATPEEPAGNASTEAWAEFAKTKGATDADLVDSDGKPLGRDEIRAKYGTPSDGGQSS
jgi:hypothetical protein